jgi:hypothetical protein
MGSIERYREALRRIADWEPYLLKESRLPGPRGNLELAQAVADEGEEEFFLHLARQDALRAPTGTPHEFLAFCGVLGLGRLLAEGRLEYLSTLRMHANDPRWRVREAVAMALQRLGSVNMGILLREMEPWSTGSRLEQRAAIAALCEPKLLASPEDGQRVLCLLDRVTSSIVDAKDAASEQYRVLCKGLSYCWSVAVAAAPGMGKRLMETWLGHPEKSIRRIMRANLSKKRLARMDQAWVLRWLAKLAS